MTRRMLWGSVAALIAISIPLAAMQAERKIYKISDEGVKGPQLSVKHEPQYTPDAKEAKIEGTVKLSVVIDAEGRPRDIRVEKGLDPGLDRNAVSAIETWLFRPAEKDGKPVAVAAHIEVNYRLK